MKQKQTAHLEVAVVSYGANVLKLCHGRKIIAPPFPKRPTSKKKREYISRRKGYPMNSQSHKYYLDTSQYVYTHVRHLN